MYQEFFDLIQMFGNNFDSHDDKILSEKIETISNNPSIELFPSFYVNYRLTIERGYGPWNMVLRLVASMKHNDAASRKRVDPHMWRREVHGSHSTRHYFLAHSEIQQKAASLKRRTHPPLSPLPPHSSTSSPSRSSTSDEPH